MKTPFTCHGAFYKQKAKNAANSASARNPIDFVSAEELVKVHQLFKWVEVRSIGF
jgi:hypothetical protein